jgi:uncharacterized protein YdhG (YjbR/CyaY superfamily)
MRSAANGSSKAAGYARTSIAISLAQLMAKKTPAKRAPKAKAGSKPKTIDHYLKTKDEAQRAALQRLRKIIGAAVPAAEECISYQMPAFRLEGKAFVWFAAAAQHCALYGVRESEAGELEGYDTSGRGTLRFQLETPLPAALIKKLVKARIQAAKRREIRNT